jgi:hypothetical protein
VLFHAILQLSFIRFQVQFKKKPEAAGSQLNAETIRLLRERVEQESDDMRIGVSDQTISAVATLVAIEVSGSCFLCVHMLSVIICSMRGGI